MLICPRCQAPSSGGRFCTVCGWEFAVPVAQPAARQASASRGRSRAAVLVGGIVAGALVAGGALVGYHAVSGGDDHTLQPVAATAPVTQPEQAQPKAPAPVTGSGTAGTAPRASQPAAPWVSLTCPSDGYGYESARLRFGYQYRAEAAPARVVVDYGDGKSYTTNRADWIDSAFWHDYQPNGQYQVSVRLIDALGREAVDSCSFSYAWDGDGE